MIIARKCVTWIIFHHVNPNLTLIKKCVIWAIFDHVNPNISITKKIRYVGNFSSCKLKYIHSMLNCMFNPYENLHSVYVPIGRFYLS